MAKNVDNTNLGYLISKIKAAFWPKTDVTNVTLADVAVTGDYDDLTNKPAAPVSWEFDLIRNASYTTWESVNMTQEIYDAIINGTIKLINIKWYFEREVGIPLSMLSHNAAGVIDVRSGFSGAVCAKVLTFYVNSDGTVDIMWD